MHILLWCNISLKLHLAQESNMATHKIGWIIHCSFVSLVIDPPKLFSVKRLSFRASNSPWLKCICLLLKMEILSENIIDKCMLKYHNSLIIWYHIIHTEFIAFCIAKQLGWKYSFFDILQISKDLYVLKAVTFYDLRQNIIYLLVDLSSTTSTYWYLSNILRACVSHILYPPQSCVQHLHGASIPYWKDFSELSNIF